MAGIADYFAAALDHHQAGRGAEAALLYEEALAQNPRHTGAIFNLGALFAAEGRFGDAAGLYERVLELRPEDADTLAMLGNLMLAQDRVAEAEAFYRRALDENSYLAAAWVNLGNLCGRTERLDEAVRPLRKSAQHRAHTHPGPHQPWDRAAHAGPRRRGQGVLRDGGPRRSRRCHRA